MNTLILLLLLAIVIVWMAARKSSANLKPVLLVLVLIAFLILLLKLLGGAEDMPRGFEGAEAAAGRKLGEAIASSAVADGPILVLTWEGGGFNPVTARLKGLRDGLGGGRRLMYGGAFVEGMDVGKDYIKLNILRLGEDLRAYLEEHGDISAVVALRPIGRWNGLEGLQSPPFFVFANTRNWRPFMDSGLVEAAVIGNVRARDEGEGAPSDMAEIDYRLVTGSR